METDIILGAVLILQLIFIFRLSTKFQKLREDLIRTQMRQQRILDLDSKLNELNHQEQLLILNRALRERAPVREV